MSEVIDELRIQECVDGELDEARQHALLKTLDESGGWKQLALAFLEEQHWQKSFRQCDAAAQAQQAARPLSSLPATKTGGRSTFWTQVTCALIALVAGVLIGDIWRARQTGTTRQVAGDHPDRGSAVADFAPPQPAGHGETQPDSTAGPRFVVDLPSESGTQPNVQLPAFPLDDVLRGRVRYDSPLDIPNNVRQAISRSGYRFQRDQQLMLLDLEDGSQIAIPLESLKLLPDGQ